MFSLQDTMKKLAASIKRFFNIVPQKKTMLGRWRIDNSTTFTKVDQQNEDHCACNTLRETYLEKKKDVQVVNKKNILDYDYFTPFLL